MMKGMSRVTEKKQSLRVQKTSGKASAESEAGAANVVGDGE